MLDISIYKESTSSINNQSEESASELVSTSVPSINNRPRILKNHEGNYFIEMDTIFQALYLSSEKPLKQLNDKLRRDNKYEVLICDC